MVADLAQIFHAFVLVGVARDHLAVRPRVCRGQGCEGLDPVRHTGNSRPSHHATPVVAHQVKAVNAGGIGNGAEVVNQFCDRVFFQRLGAQAG